MFRFCASVLFDLFFEQQVKFVQQPGEMGYIGCAELFDCSVIGAVLLLRKNGLQGGMGFLCQIHLDDASVRRL